VQLCPVMTGFYLFSVLTSYNQLVTNFPVISGYGPVIFGFPNMVTGLGYG
jgi:hypothetical protein